MLVARMLTTDGEDAEFFGDGADTQKSVPRELGDDSL